MILQKTFSERTWKDRKEGDPAFFYHSENKFEQHWPGPYAHFGLGTQTENMATYKMGAIISHAPDYIAALTENSTPVLVEVQGTGRGGATPEGTLVHKFKHRKLEALKKWNSIHETTLWLWNDTNQTSVWTSYASITLMIAQGLGEQGLFDGHRPYWSIPVSVIEANADTDRLTAKYNDQGR